MTTMAALVIDDVGGPASPCDSQWAAIAADAPVLAGTMGRYLDQIAVSLRPATVTSAEVMLRRLSSRRCRLGRRRAAPYRSVQTIPPDTAGQDRPAAAIGCDDPDDARHVTDVLRTGLGMGIPGRAEKGVDLQRGSPNPGRSAPEVPLRPRRREADAHSCWGRRSGPSPRRRDAGPHRTTGR